MNIAVMRSSGIFIQKNCTLRTWSVLFLDDLVFIIHQIIRAIPKGICQKFFHLILVQIDIAEISIVFRVVNIICARIAGCLSLHKSYSVLSMLCRPLARSAPKPPKKNRIHHSYQFPVIICDMTQAPAAPASFTCCRLRFEMPPIA